MTETEKLTQLFELLLAQEWPLVLERAVVSVGRTAALYEVAPLGPRVEIRFGRATSAAPNLMQVVHDAGAAAEQLLSGAAAPPRHPSMLVELHERRVFGTDGTQLLAKIAMSKDGVRLREAKDWLFDAEGIRASLRVEGHGYFALRVPRELASAARRSYRLFSEEWDGAQREAHRRKQ